MKVTVNGEARELPERLSLTDLLESLGLPASRVAIEVNREIVTRATFPECRLQDGDCVEIVTFVGGG